MNHGYSEQVTTNYITQDGISAKINSIMITDDKFCATVDFKFDDSINLDSERFSFGYAVYDEDKNVYAVYTRMHLGSNEKYDLYTPFLYKEIGVKYNKNDIYAIQITDNCGIQNVSAKDRNITSQIEIGTSKEFPRSKKIFIRLFDLGYSMTQVSEENMINAEDFSLSNSEWLFELNVPEKFYNRETTNLKLKSEIPGLKIKKMTVTETGLVVKGTIDGFSKFVTDGFNLTGDEWTNARNELFNITDEDGNIYYENTLGTVQSMDGFKMEFPITKSMINKKFFANVSINGVKYSSEIVVDSDNYVNNNIKNIQ